MPDLRAHIRGGNLLPLRDWLRQKIHRHGRRYKPAELLQEVTGQSPKADYFIDYLKTKFGGM